MTTTSSIIKEKIKEILLGTVGLGQVENYPNQDFNKYPAAQISYDGNTSNYLTNSENDILYTFSVYLFQIVEGSINRETARLIMEELTDTICDSFDSDEFLNGIALPSGKTMIGVKPTTVEIGEDEEGKFTVAKLELATRVTKLN